MISELGSEYLEPLKQKGAYPYEHMSSFKRFDGKKLPNKEYFFSSKKKEKFVMMVKN